ncbi:MAG: hypothetical protein HY791_39095 [Deltaproteobacteria bacterium]|nr:hypothetical protein [Deltaproteobacteria bacterium]
MKIRDMKILLARLSVSAVLALASCAESSGENQASDAAASDAAVPDAMSSDAQTPDAGFEPRLCDPSFGADQACGGDISGVWRYLEGCGESSIEQVVLDLCNDVDIRSAELTGGTGSLAVEGARFTLEVEGRGQSVVNLGPSCNPIGCGATQFVITTAADRANIEASAVCADDGSSGCDCELETPFELTTTGTISVSNGIATVQTSRGEERFYYCAKDDRLTMKAVGRGAGVLVLER